MGSKFGLVDIGAGQRAYRYDEDDPRGVEEAYISVMENLRDPATGDFTVEGVQRLRYIVQPPQNAAQLQPNVAAMLQKVQAKARQMLAEISAMARVTRANTLTAMCLKNLGYGVPVPTISIKSPRGVAGFILGYMATAYTQRTFGLSQLTYASIPLIDIREQEPTYASFGPPVLAPWVPLNFAMNEYHCESRGCAPLLPAGSIWYPETPLDFSFVQIASQGPEAVAGQDHSIALYIVSKIRCYSDDKFDKAARENADEIRAMRQMYGHV